MECECEFRSVRPKIRFGVGRGIEEMTWIVRLIKCLCNGRRIVRRKSILRCRKCGNYSVECPYCHQNSVIAVLPDVAKCPYCGKVYQIKLFEF